MADDAHGLLLYVAAGSPIRQMMAGENDLPRRLVAQQGADWRLVLGSWRTDMLMLFPPGAAHSVWWFFRPDGAFDCW